MIVVDRLRDAVLDSSLTLAWLINLPTDFPERDGTLRQGPFPKRTKALRAGTSIAWSDQ